MTALSAKDKIKLRLSAERLERWNRLRVFYGTQETPEQRKACGVKSDLTIVSPGQEKPVEEIRPDKLDSLYRNTDGFKVRTMAGKLGRHGNAVAARVHTIAHTDRETGVTLTQIVADHPDNDLSPREPAWKQGQVREAKARPDSPFKRAGRAASKVVIVRK